MKKLDSLKNKIKKVDSLKNKIKKVDKGEVLSKVGVAVLIGASFAVGNKYADYVHARGLRAILEPRPELRDQFINATIETVMSQK